MQWLEEKRGKYERVSRQREKGEKKQPFIEILKQFKNYFEAFLKQKIARSGKKSKEKLKGF